MTIMKKQLFLLMLSVAFIFTGCDNEKGENGIFTPPAQEQLTQNAYADNENTGGGFSFTTGARWKATVEEVKLQEANSAALQTKSFDTESNGSNVVWLKLYNGNKEAYSGDAGNITLRIEIDQNYTGERREATITIRTGNNTFTVTVVQEGTKQDGSQNEAPVKVTEISLDKTELSLKRGDKTVLTASVKPEDATIKSVIWSSSNYEVAGVHPLTGEVVAIADGRATITATSSSNKAISASCAVVVGDSEPVIPENYAYITKIERKVKYWNILSSEQQDEEDATYTFEYDAQNRVSSYTIDMVPTNEPDAALRLVSKIDYSSRNYLHIVDRWTEQETQETQTQTYDILLNDKGYIKEGKSHPYYDYENADAFYTYTMDYNNEDCLSRIAYNDTWKTFVYKDGVISGGAYHYGDDGEQGEESGFDKNFSQVPNDKLNLDINILFMPTLLSEETLAGEVPGRLGRLALLRLAGRGCARYVTANIGWEDDMAESAGNLGYPNPGEVIHVSHEYITTDENKVYPLDYTFNADETVASVTAYMALVKIRHEHDIVVGNELVHPERPELGYKYKIENSKETELSRGRNTFVYTFTYR